MRAAGLRPPRLHVDAPHAEHSGRAPEATQNAAPLPRIARTPSAGLRPLDPNIRGPAFRPDRLVDLVRVGAGSDVFEPSVAPFERMVTLNRIRLDTDGRTPVLLLDPGTVHTVRLPPPPASQGASRVTFRGVARFDFSKEARLPLPTPAAGSRLLEARADPNVPLRFLRDEADNLYIEAPGYRGTLRLTFRLDAPTSYFGAPLPELPPALLHPTPPTMPDTLRRRALRSAALLGLSPKDTTAHILRTLAAHFRAFDDEGDPPAGPDVLRALVLGGRGVCRHRAYAFVVLAQALGLPARFVHNEVHAWAEVQLGAGDWLRVDLGGALLGRPASPQAPSTPSTPESPPPPPWRAAYQPPVGDPFPQPPAYRRALALLTARRSPQGGESDTLTDPLAPSHDETASNTLREATNAPPPRARIGRATSRHPVVIRLSSPPTQLVRNRPIELRGTVRTADGGLPASGLRIEAWIHPLGGSPRPLASTLSTADGSFRIRVTVPSDIPAGAYRMTVSTPGDDRYLPTAPREPPSAPR